MKLLKFLLFIPLIILNTAGAPLATKEPTAVLLENAQVINVNRPRAGSGTIHFLAVITVSTAKKDTIKLYATYFGEQQTFPSEGDICTVDAYEFYSMGGIAADGVSTANKVLIYPLTMECGGEIFTYLDISNVETKVYPFIE